MLLTFPGQPLVPRTAARCQPRGTKPRDPWARKMRRVRKRWERLRRRDPSGCEERASAAMEKKQRSGKRGKRDRHCYRSIVSGFVLLPFVVLFAASLWLAMAAEYIAACERERAGVACPTCIGVECDGL